MINSPSSHGVKLLTKKSLGHPRLFGFLPRHPLGPAEVNPPSIAGGPGRFVRPSCFGGGSVAGKFTGESPEIYPVVVQHSHGKWMNMVHL